MTAATATSVKTLSPLGWLRIILRLGAMVTLLFACVALHCLWRIVRAPSRWPRRFLAGVAWIVGARVSTSGEHGMPARLYLANHVSWIDIPVLAGATGTAFVAHDGLASIPVLRWLCALNDTVFVARHDRRSIAAQIAQVREAFADAGALTIFPEGTTSTGDTLLPFKSSLLSALDGALPGTTVQPVLIDYGAASPDIAWVGDEHGLDNFLCILAHREPIRVHLAFLPPLNGESLANRKTIATAARDAIATALAQSRKD